ncbi:MAG: Gfo/Idh/MocA family oxidoreductase [Pseudomonadota bacterium]
MHDNNINVGIVGCGHIAQKHMTAIDEQSHALSCVAICDTSEARLEGFYSDRSLARYHSLEALLAHDDLDLVVLCTPSGLHREQAIACARADVNVLCEKPLAVSLDDARAIEMAFSDGQASIFIVKQVRYNPCIQYVKNLMQVQAFGSLYHVGLNAYWSRPQAYFDAAPWRGTKALDGGMLFNQMIHCIDLLEWLFGPLNTIGAQSVRLAREIETEDVVTSSLVWNSGAVGSFNATILATPHNFETTLVILGSRGVVKLGGAGLNEIEYSMLETDVAKPNLADHDVSWHGALYADVVRDLGSTDSPSYAPSLASAIRDIELIEAMYRSSATQSFVTV